MSNPTNEAYSELQQVFDHFNKHLFNDKLPPCLITLQRKKNTYGYYCHERFVNANGETTDEIAMNPTFFHHSDLLEITQTIVHEMVHAKQQHFGKPGRGSYHNKEWAAMMEEIGLMPSSTGKPGGKKTGDCMSDYPIEGGKFLEAFELLATNDFKISWADRFPNRQKVAESINTGETEKEDWNLEEIGLVENEETGLIEPIKENNSNRVKFTCPACLDNLWGKPSIMAICAKCNQAFIPNYQPPETNNSKENEKTGE